LKEAAAKGRRKKTQLFASLANVKPRGKQKKRKPHPFSTTIERGKLPKHSKHFQKEKGKKKRRFFLREGGEDTRVFPKGGGGGGRGRGV